ncbi:hypothetical protein [Glaciecola sp. MF2-115]|uniref:hypothetical protein n=1 Tax=Glaciecola sp. MF2-115 TaxID=3384827 RepID=UPI0039A1B308
MSNTKELREAIESAIPGDVIVLADGEYIITGAPLRLGRPNYSFKSLLPIILSSENYKKAVIKVSRAVGMQITHKNWIVSNLVFEGTCDADSSCEHALHIFGDADDLQIIGNDFVNFNAAIKANGSAFSIDSSTRHFPDQVLVDNNRFYNHWTRETKAPVTPIDVVGGSNWTISNNFIADFSRLYRNKPSYTYGAFLKGDSKNGVFKSNFVACNWRVPYYSALDQRVGLSFGGGGTGHEFCATGNCEQEHRGGEMSDNVIVNCSQSASVYINNSHDINVLSNSMIGSSGIELRRSKNIKVMENLMNGKIRPRDEISSFAEQSNQYFHDQINYLRP